MDNRARAACRDVSRCPQAKASIRARMTWTTKLGKHVGMGLSKVQSDYVDYTCDLFMICSFLPTILTDWSIIFGIIGRGNIY